MLNIQGSLLVASPHLPDPNFYRTVVLMIEHSDDGALGVILNRISDTPLRRVWESVCNSECVSNEHLFVGGPVEGPLMALHRDMNLEGVEILPGLAVPTKVGLTSCQAVQCPCIPVVILK